MAFSFCKKNAQIDQNDQFEHLMKTLTASDAKREFGDLLLQIQSEPVGIHKNGKPVAVVLSYSEYEHLATCKLNQLKAMVQQGVEDVAAGKVSSGSEVMARLRQRIS